MHNLNQIRHTGLDLNYSMTQGRRLTCSHTRAKAMQWRRNRNRMREVQSSESRCSHVQICATNRERKMETLALKSINFLKTVLGGKNYEPWCIKHEFNHHKQLERNSMKQWLALSFCSLEVVAI